MKKRVLFPKAIERQYDWAFRHYHELAKRYPDQWIAFSNRRVLASGPSLMRVLEKARERWKPPEGSYLPHLFVESEVHIYVGFLHRA